MRRAMSAIAFLLTASAALGPAAAARPAAAEPAGAEKSASFQQRLRAAELAEITSADLTDAIAIYEEIAGTLDAPPAIRARALLRLAACEKKRGNLARAIRVLERLVAMAPPGDPSRRSAERILQGIRTAASEGSNHDWFNSLGKNRDVQVEAFRLATELASGDRGRRKAAEIRLRAMGPVALPVLRKLVETSSGEVRARAARVAAEAGDYRYLRDFVDSQAEFGAFVSIVLRYDPGLRERLRRFLERWPPTHDKAGAKGGPGGAGEEKAPAPVAGKARRPALRDLQAARDVLLLACLETDDLQERLDRIARDERFRPWLGRIFERYIRRAPSARPALLERLAGERAEVELLIAFAKVAPEAIPADLAASLLERFREDPGAGRALPKVDVYRATPSLWLPFGEFEAVPAARSVLVRLLVERGEIEPLIRLAEGGDPAVRWLVADIAGHSRTRAKEADRARLDLRRAPSLAPIVLALLQWTLEEPARYAGGSPTRVISIPWALSFLWRCARGDGPYVDEFFAALRELGSRNIDPSRSYWKAHASLRGVAQQWAIDGEPPAPVELIAAWRGHFDKLPPKAKRIALPLLAFEIPDHPDLLDLVAPCLETPEYLTGTSEDFALHDEAIAVLRWISTVPEGVRLRPDAEARIAALADRVAGLLIEDFERDRAWARRAGSSSKPFDEEAWLEHWASAGISGQAARGRGRGTEALASLDIVAGLLRRWEQPSARDLIRALGLRWTSQMRDSDLVQRSRFLLAHAHGRARSGALLLLAKLAPQLSKRLRSMATPSSSYGEVYRARLRRPGSSRDPQRSLTLEARAREGKTDELLPFVGGCVREELAYLELAAVAREAFETLWEAVGDPSVPEEVNRSIFAAVEWAPFDHLLRRILSCEDGEVLQALAPRKARLFSKGVPTLSNYPFFERGTGPSRAARGTGRPRPLTLLGHSTVGAPWFDALDPDHKRKALDALAGNPSPQAQLLAAHLSQGIWPPGRRIEALRKACRKPEVARVIFRFLDPSWGERAIPVVREILTHPPEDLRVFHWGDLQPFSFQEILPDLEATRDRLASQGSPVPTRLEELGQRIRARLQGRKAWRERGKDGKGSGSEAGASIPGPQAGRSPDMGPEAVPEQASADGPREPLRPQNPPGAGTPLLALSASLPVAGLKSAAQEESAREEAFRRLAEGEFLEMSLGDLDGAEKAYRAILRDPEAGENVKGWALRRLAGCAERRGDIDGARKLYEQLRDAHPLHRAHAEEALKRLASGKPRVEESWFPSVLEDPRIEAEVYGVILDLAAPPFDAQAALYLVPWERSLRSSLSAKAGTSTAKLRSLGPLARPLLRHAAALSGDPDLRRNAAVLLAASGDLSMLDVVLDAAGPCDDLAQSALLGPEATREKVREAVNALPDLEHLDLLRIACGAGLPPVRRIRGLLARPDPDGRVARVLVAGWERIKAQILPILRQDPRCVSPDILAGIAGADPPALSVGEMGRILATSIEMVDLDEGHGPPRSSPGRGRAAEDPWTRALIEALLARGEVSAVLSHVAPGQWSDLFEVLTKVPAESVIEARIFLQIAMRARRRETAERARDALLHVAAKCPEALPVLKRLFDDPPDWPGFLIPRASGTREQRHLFGSGDWRGEPANLAYPRWEGHGSSSLPALRPHFVAFLESLADGDRWEPRLSALKWLTSRAMPNLQKGALDREDVGRLARFLEEPGLDRRLLWLEPIASLDDVPKLDRLARFAARSTWLQALTAMIRGCRGAGPEVSREVANILIRDFARTCEATDDPWMPLSAIGAEAYLRPFYGTRGLRSGPLPAILEHYREPHVTALIARLGPYLPAPSSGRSWSRQDEARIGRILSRESGISAHDRARFAIAYVESHGGLFRPSGPAALQVIRRLLEKPLTGLFADDSLSLETRWNLLRCMEVLSPGDGRFASAIIPHLAKIGFYTAVAERAWLVGAATGGRISSRPWTPARSLARRGSRFARGRSGRVFGRSWVRAEPFEAIFGPCFPEDLRPEAVLALTHHDDPAIREVAIGQEAAQFVDAPDLRRRLLEMRKDPSPEVRKAVAQGLARLKDLASAADVFPLLRDPSPEVRVAAAWSAKSLGPEKARGALLERLDDPDPRVQDAVLRALEPLARAGSGGAD